MTHNLKMREEYWAEMAPDVYAGPNCDEVRPNWRIDVEKEGPEDIGDLVQLSARTFPPGSQIIIRIPECPQCHTPADFAFNPITMSMDKCECGFDWNEWAQDEYS